MSKPIEQKIELNASSDQLTIAFNVLQKKIEDANKAIRNANLSNIKDLESASKVISANLKTLSKAKAEMKTLMADVEAANKKALAEQKKALEEQKRITDAAYKARAEAARIEGQSAREFYKEKSRLARLAAAEEKKLAQEVTAYESTLDKQRIARARELAAARREAAKAAVGGRVGGLTDVDQAKLQRAAVDARLRDLRREREALAGNDAAAARGVAQRIQDQKALGVQLDAVIRKLEQQRLAMQGRLAGSQRLLAPERVQVTANNLGSAAAALQFYRAEQAAARDLLQTTLATKNITAQQIAQAQEKLRLANANVTAARALARAESTDTKTRQLTAHQAQLRLAQAFAQQQIASLGPAKALAEAVARTAAAQERLAKATAETQKARLRDLELAQKQQAAIERASAKKERESAPGPLGSILSPGYAAAAFARTSVYGAAASTVYGISSTVTDSISSLVTLEDELAKLQAIAGATDTQMQQLTASIFEIGAGSRYSLNDLARISQTLAQAGISASQMSDVLRSVTTLATASGSSPDEAVNLVTSAIGSFQLHTSEAARVADLMTSALNRTKLTVQQTAQAIQYVGATAYEQNISLEQLLATVGGIAQAGVRSGSTIGTGFRQFLVDLQTPSDKLREQLTQLNITAADVDVTTRGLPAVLDTLREKGFGAAAAYQGLETRAAAFYLVAKNNVDVMDNLQLAFADTNVAAAANEKAMDSMIAQWQRFKNILTVKIEDSFTPWSERITDSLDRVSDYFEETESQQRALTLAIAEGTPELEAYQEVYGAWEGKLEYVNSYLAVASEGWMSLLGRVYDYTVGTEEATSATEAAATAVAEASEAVDNQAARMTELDKEIQRLIVQKNELRNNDARTSAEMVTLMQRFEGLASHLVLTANRYDDLTAAVRRYRIEQAAEMGTRLDAQISSLSVQSATARQAAGQGVAGILGSPEYKGLLSKRAIEALETIRTGTPGTDQVRVATAVLTNEVTRLTDSNRRVSGTQLEVAKRLDTVVSNISTASGAKSTIPILERQAEDRRIESTRRIGGYATEGLSQVNGLMTQLQSAEGTKRAELKREMGSRLTGLETQLRLAQANPFKSPGEARWIVERQQEVSTLRSQYEGLLKAAATSEAETAEKTARADRRRTREAEATKRGPRPKRQPAVGKPVTQRDVDRVGREMGLPLGSGVRSVAEQWSLFRRRKTRATPDKSDHSNGGAARDFGVAHLSDAEAVAMAERMKARYKALGIEAQVLYERGTKKGGPPEGTARHIHVGVKKGSRFKSGQDAGDGEYDGYSSSEMRAEAEAAARKRRAVAAAELDIMESDFASRLRQMRETEGKEGFPAAILAAKESLSKLQKKMFDEAETKLFEDGVDIESPEYAAGMMKVADSIAKRTEEYQKIVGDTIIASADEQLRGAEEAFEAGLRPYELKIKTLKAQSSGLSTYTLRNKVPDFVGQLNDLRSSKAEERAREQEYALLGPRIEEQRKALYLANWRSMTTGTTDETQKEIEKLRKELENLLETQQLLEAELSAGGLLPTSLTEGLVQAVEAYRELNGLNNTFSQNLMLNMTGAIETVHSSFANMFTSIISGSESALGAVGKFAMGVADYMFQLAGQMLAQQALNGLFSLLGSFVGVPGGLGSSGGGFGGLGASATSFSFGGRFNGGPADPAGTIYRKSGGEVSNGSASADSVFLKAAKGEWVINKKSVDSVGPQFMAQLNQHGAKALSGLQSMPKIDMKSRTETNVYVVPPQQRPTLQKDDVLIIMQEDMLTGTTGRLIQKIVRE
jgi:TP901 family phage tail tape measure protein